jgi:GTP-binding protein
MTEFTPDQLEAARKLFAGAVTFIKGAVDLPGLPDNSRPEIAFAGRSNVGKSSLINALCNRKNLARASNTPGRTQEINFFDVGEGRFNLVDLPGYGFADAPKAHVDNWRQFTLAYLRSRSKLRRAFVLVDSRRGVGDVDRDFFEALDSAAVGYQVVLTKADKLKKSEVGPTVEAAIAALRQHPAAHPHVIATSSEKGVGLPDLRAEILSLL